MFYLERRYNFYLHKCTTICVKMQCCLILKTFVAMMQKLVWTDVNHDHVLNLDQNAYVALRSELQHQPQMLVIKISAFPWPTSRSFCTCSASTYMYFFLFKNSNEICFSSFP